MAITDFGSLKTAVAARAIRSDLTALIPDFIRAAHDVIVGRLAVSTDLTISDATPDMPSDFRTVVSVLADVYTAAPLSLVNAAQMTGSSTGAPVAFSVSGSVMTVYPAPDATYSGRLLYKLDRTFFSADSDTNTALTRYPFLYLDGAMAELFAHTRNADERDRYLNLFLGGIDTANQVEVSDLYGSATLQPRPAMVV